MLIQDYLITKHTIPKVNIIFVIFHMICMIINLSIIMFIFIIPNYKDIIKNIDLLKLYFILVCYVYVQVYESIKTIFQPNSSGHTICIGIMLHNSLISFIIHQTVEQNKIHDKVELYYILILLFMFQAAITFFHKHIRRLEFFLSLFHKVGPHTTKIRAYNQRKSLKVIVEIDIINTILLFYVRIMFDNKKPDFTIISFIASIFTNRFTSMSIDNEHILRKKLALFLNFFELAIHVYYQNKSLWNMIINIKSHIYLTKSYYIFTSFLLNILMLIYNIIDYSNYGKGLDHINVKKRTRIHL